MSHQFVLRALIVSAGLGLICNSALAQPSYSIDFQGPTIGAADPISGALITEGDILITPSPPMHIPLLGALLSPPPTITIFGGPGGPPPPCDLGLWWYVPGYPGGTPGLVEVDAMSYGVDSNLVVDLPLVWYFSVDEFAAGDPLSGGTAGPDVFTEGFTGGWEASADVFASLGLPQPFGSAPMMPPPQGSFTNQAIFDGDGFAPFGGPGLGMVEPHPPGMGLPDGGDNLDAMELDVPVQPAPGGYFPVYFSLDSAFPDPAEPTPPVNSGSAAAHGFVGGDILVTWAPGAAPVVFAAALQLGLDQFGPDTDDVDALILADYPDGIYTPSETLWDWGPGPHDLLLFSVRRGSAIIGQPDSLHGWPIEEGDILLPPMLGALNPGIFIPAEALGLRTTRAGFVLPSGFPDELDAMDITTDCDFNGIPDWYDMATAPGPLDTDCNENGVYDACEIYTGAVEDINGNGVPDECEVPGDVDGDGDCDWADLAIVLGNFGCQEPPDCPGDINNDGEVEFADVGIVILHYGYPTGYGECDEPGPGPFDFDFTVIDNTAVDPGDDPLALEFDGGNTHFTFDLRVYVGLDEDFAASGALAEMNAPGCEFFLHGYTFDGSPPDPAWFGTWPASEFNSYWMAPTFVPPGGAGEYGNQFVVIYTPTVLNATWYDIVPTPGGPFSIARYTMIVPPGGGALTPPEIVPQNTGGYTPVIGTIDAWSTNASLTPGCGHSYYDIIWCGIDGDGNGIGDDCECREDLVPPVGVEQQDLNAVLNRWGDAECLPGGTAHPCVEDLALPEGVEQQDLNAVLNRWGDPFCEIPRDFGGAGKRPMPAGKAESL